MPVTKANSGSNVGTSSNSTSLAVTIPTPTSGRVLTAVFSFNTNADGLSISGGGVTTWQTAVNYLGGERRIRIWYGVVNTTPSTTVTVSYAKVSAARWCAVDEWAGLAQSSILDVTATNTGTSTVASTGSNTTTQVGAIVAGTYHSGNNAITSGPTGGFTLHADFGAGDLVFNAYYKLPSATATEECTVTHSSSAEWRGAWAAFKPAASQSVTCGTIASPAALYAPTVAVYTGPVWQSSAQNFTNGTSLTISKPSGLAVGDLLLFTGTLGDQFGTVTPPTGFSELRRDNTAWGSVAAFYVFYKIAVQADVDATDFTWSYTATRNHVGALHRISGATTTGIVAASVDDSGSFTLTCPNITTPADDSLVMWGEMYYEDETGTVSRGTERLDWNYSATEWHIYAATEAVASAGLQTGADITDTNNNTHNKHMFSVAIQRLLRKSIVIGRSRITAHLAM